MLLVSAPGATLASLETTKKGSGVVLRPTQGDKEKARIAHTRRATRGSFEAAYLSADPRLAETQEEVPRYLII